VALVLRSRHSDREKAGELTAFWKSGKTGIRGARGVQLSDPGIIRGTDLAGMKGRGRLTMPAMPSLQPYRRQTWSTEVALSDEDGAAMSDESLSC